MRRKGTASEFIAEKRNQVLCATSRMTTSREKGGERTRSDKTYRNLKVHHLLRKRRHLIVEAEPILPDTLRRKYKISLSLLGAIQNDLFAGGDYRVIDIERTAGLDLKFNVSINRLSF